MARLPRIVLPGIAHHVVARGVNRHRLFAKGREKQKYLMRFALIAAECSVLVHGYTIMDNHVHWMVTPQSPDGLATLFRRMHTWWAMVFNRKYARSGHLFQGRFSSVPLKENHYWAALRYVEINPRRAGLVTRDEDFEFSSARAHLSGKPDPLIALARAESRRQFTAAQWRDFLTHTDSQREDQLRRAQRGSRPLGDPAWIAELEQRWKRKLAWSPPGRPATLRAASSKTMQ